MCWRAVKQKSNQNYSQGPVQCSPNRYFSSQLGVSLGLIFSLSLYFLPSDFLALGMSGCYIIKLVNRKIKGKYCGNISYFESFIVIVIIVKVTFSVLNSFNTCSSIQFLRSDKRQFLIFLYNSNSSSLCLFWAIWFAGILELFSFHRLLKCAQ